MRLNTDFPSSFVVDTDPDLPTLNEDVRSFRSYQPLGIHTAEFHDVRFYLSGQTEWLGRFEKGSRERFANATFTTPSPREACVISAGAAYWVDAHERTAIAMEYLPITSIEAFPRHGLLILTTWRDIFAHRSAYATWSLAGVVSDRLRIVGAEDSCLIARGFDGASVTLRVDIEHGTVVARSYGE